MKALDQSAALIRRSDTLRARSVRIRAAVAESIEKSRRRPPPCATGSVTGMNPGSGDAAWLDHQRFETVRLESRALRRASAQARVRARVSRERARRGRSLGEILRDSPFARLHAKLGTMPVIEQAKGIVMALQGCAPDEAFDLLRQVSQRTNVKVHVLAAQIVEQAASGGHDNVTPILPSTTGRRRPQIADTGSHPA